VVDVETFLKTIFKDIETDEVVLLAKQSKLGGAFVNMRVPGAIRAIGNPKPAAMYFNISTVREPEKGEKLRRRKQDCIAVYCFVADDIGTKIDKVMPTPTWIMETSKGNFQYGYRLHAQDDLARYEAFAARMGELGYTDKGALDCCRLMRVPGSVNIKEGRGLFVSTVREWSPDSIWSLEELAGLFDIDLGALPVRSAVKPKEVGTTVEGGVDTEIIQWLTDGGYVINDDGTDFITIKCPWWESHTDGHVPGHDTAGYSPLGRGTEWVQWRAFKCLHDHCANKKFPEFIKWVVSQGGDTVSRFDPLPWLQSRYVYVAMTQQIADTEQRLRGGDRWLWELAAWTKRHPGKMRVPDSPTPVSVAYAFIGGHDTRKVDAAIYLPVKAKDDKVVIEHRGQPFVNVYVPPQHADTDDLPEIFLSHMDYLIPSEEERTAFISWLAHKIQNPLSRSYAVCMVTDEVFGIGRSWIKSILNAALQGKVNSASLAQLVGKGTQSENNYNDWMVNCQFLIIDEAKDEIDRDIFYAAYEKFKQRIDNHPVSERINVKYGQATEQLIYFNCLIFSNHLDALALPENDRRVLVITNNNELNTPEYYENLYTSIKDEAAKLYWFLMRRDLRNFDHVYPIETPGKLAMVEQNKSPSDAIYSWVLENIKSDLATQESLKKHVVSAAIALNYEYIMMKPGAVIRRIWGKLGNLRGEKNGARYVLVGKRCEIRCFRNEKKWKAIDDERNLEAFLKELG